MVAGSNEQNPLPGQIVMATSTTKVWHLKVNVRFVTQPFGVALLGQRDAGNFGTLTNGAGASNVDLGKEPVTRSLPSVTISLIAQTIAT